MKNLFNIILGILLGIFGVFTFQKYFTSKDANFIMESKELKTFFGSFDPQNFNDSIMLRERNRINKYGKLKILTPAFEEQVTKAGWENSLPFRQTPIDDSLAIAMRKMMFLNLAKDSTTRKYTKNKLACNQWIWISRKNLLESALSLYLSKDTLTGMRIYFGHINYCAFDSTFLKDSIRNAYYKEKDGAIIPLFIPTYTKTLANGTEIDADYTKASYMDCNCGNPPGKWITCKPPHGGGNGGKCSDKESCVSCGE